MFKFHDSAAIHFQDELPEQADVVVIGAGVIGICTAWQLQQRGLSVAVCDKGRVAGEQSSRNWGWVRSSFRDPDEVPIAMEATRLWAGLQEELGDDIGFRQEGVLALAHTESEMADIGEWLDIARQYGLDTRTLSATEARKIASAPDDRWAGGVFTANDGRAEPFTAVPALARAIQTRGAKIREACAVRVVETEAGHISAVVTEHGRVKTHRVVCAAGGWSALFLSNLGVSLPQLVVRGTVARTEPTEEFFSGAGAFGDVHLRRRLDGGYTVACGFAEHFIGADSFRKMFKFLPSMSSASELTVRLGADPTQQGILNNQWGADQVSPFEKTRVLNPISSPAALKKIRRKLAAQVPQLADTPLAESWAGMIDATADVVPVMDAVDGYPGLFLATGFSGHGFGIGPGAGKVMADLVTGQDSGFDLSRFRFGRFFDGSKMRPGPAI